MTDSPPSPEIKLPPLLEIELNILEAELRDTLSEKPEAVRQIRALRAIVIYLSRIGLDNELLSPFVTIIGDVQKNFETKSQGSNLKPLILAERHAICAAAVDYLRYHADVPLKEALSLVSRLTDLDATQLDDLRKNIRKKKNRARPEARVFYDNWMEGNRALFDSLPPARRKTAVLNSVGKIMDRPAANLG